MSTKPKTGSIYLIAPSPRNGKVKIGLTLGDPKRRLKQLQTGAADVLELLHVFEIPGGKTLKVEQDLHKQFNYRKHRGEWFSFNEDDETIRGIISGYLIYLRSDNNFDNL